MAFLYILYSEERKKFYTGATHDIDNRMAFHLNKKYGTTHYTSSTDDWELFLTIEVETYDQAIRLERKIKSMKSSKYIRNLQKYEELREKIINETKLNI